jgi:hypothetical protein
MWQDPIVEEIHKIRKAQAAQFQYNVQALGKFFQAQQAAEHHEVVTRAPRRAPEVAQTTRVGRPEPNKGMEPTR